MTIPILVGGILSILAFLVVYIFISFTFLFVELCKSNLKKENELLSS